MRQLHDATSFIAHRSYIAHFRAREQALIFRVVAGNGMEKIDIFDGRQAVDLEIAEPPEMQPLAHHGMQAAIERVFYICVSIVR